MDFEWGWDIDCVGVPPTDLRRSRAPQRSRFAVHHGTTYRIAQCLGPPRSDETR